MKRIIAASITFIVGISAANFWDRALSFGIDDVPPPTSTLTSIEIDPSIPKFVPFFDSLDEDSYFSGWFIADEFTGMDEVWTLLLSQKDDSEKLEYDAMVLTSNPDGSSNDADSFIASTLTTKADRLAFTTVNIRGVHYKFDGRFLYGGSVFAEDEKVLRGTMQKIVNGKVVAKFTSDFSFHEPVCFH